MNKRGPNQRFSISRRGQVWIETVIYTLIALVIIGLVLSFVQPKIQELQDRSVLQQSISMMNSIDSTIISLSQEGAGNKREMQISVRSGTLTIDGADDLITFSMTSHYQFSEPDTPVNYGNIIVLTHAQNNLNLVNMTLNYSRQYNITFNGQDSLYSLTQSSTPYNIFISNQGGTNPNIDFESG
ncbi:MAG: hypothetical protein M1165_01565 [Candidatus Pacearchaeota archaeon]|nr:hypothetical protein [Candidatus Pacearchaeota archaeon]